jgi:hypothetical protein
VTDARVPAVQPIVCVVDETRRDIAVAEAAVAGHFTHNAVTLALGPEPDWIGGGLGGDVEWRTEWVKANEGLDLAHAYALSGCRTGSTPGNASATPVPGAASSIS